jgi:hypothetical protein
MLQCKGFSAMVVHSLMQLVMGGQTAINVNGEVGTFFPHSVVSKERENHVGYHGQ